MDYKELYRNEGYWTTKIQLELFKSLEAYMKNEGLNRTDLARKLGVTKGYVSQVLNGDFDHRLSKLVELSLAIGLVPEIKFKNLDRLVSDAKDGYRTMSMEVTIRDGQNDEKKISINNESSQPLKNVG